MHHEERVIDLGVGMPLAGRLRMQVYLTIIWAQFVQGHLDPILEPVSLPLMEPDRPIVEHTVENDLLVDCTNHNIEDHVVCKD